MKTAAARSTITRRTFLRSATAASGIVLIGCAADLAWSAETNPGTLTPLNAWVRIDPDNTVVIVVSQAEIGQGIATTLPAIIADELGADWPRVRLENAPTDPAYRNPRINWQFTGNSESTTAFFDLMREMGASAREMLVAAAAARLKVAASSLRAERSRVVHTPSGRSVTFAAVAAAAARVTPPKPPKLKPESAWTLIGRPLPRTDTTAKITGAATFGIDVSRPGMLYAAVRTCPTFGGNPARVNRSSMAGMPGVVKVVEIPNGVAVAAESWWQAQRAIRALRITWTPGQSADVNTASLAQEYRDAINGTEWLNAHRHGDDAAFARAAPTTLVADYGSPFMAHATMEPMNCTAEVSERGCEVWAPTQGQELTQMVLAQVLGLPKDQITVHRTFAGGGFGRRLVADFAVQAAVVSKSVGRPVKVIWSREEDIQHDFYRPAVANRLTAGIDEFGRLQTLRHQVVSPSILQFVYPPAVTPDFDPSCLEGTLETRYRIPNMHVDFRLLKTTIPTSVLRTTGFGPNVFALESFVDELAHLGGADPYRYRRELLDGDARALRVLDLAAERSRWSEPLAPGRSRGIAFTEAFRTLTCHVVEISTEGRRITVHRVVAVVDAGNTLDPGISTNSIEGGVAWGLTCAMYSDITFDGGRVVESNFHDYPVLRIPDMPEVDVHFVESGARPLGGIGEVGPVTVVPALTNALFAATGVRYRSLPLSRHGWTLAGGGR